MWLLTTLLCMALAGTAAAQQRELKEPRVRFGVGYRVSLALAEQAKVKAGGIKASEWGSPEYMRGGDLHLEGTVKLTPNWNAGLGVGLGLYDNDTYRAYRIYAKAEHLYGAERNRWFNYGEVGTTIYQYYNAGFTAALGGGYRWAITRRTRLDLTAGLEYLTFVADTQTKDVGVRVGRIGLTLGVAMHF